MTTSFIEKQFPVSKVSKESYKERKANNGQTLTGLGKWWGRKPLVLVRAAIIGCLMPASDNPKRDMEIFLKIMSMDDTGLWQRKEKSFSAQELYDIASNNHKLSRYVAEWFDLSGDKPKLNPCVDKELIEKKVFFTLGYDQKLTKCIRPEQLKNLSPQTWNEINEHLGTTAHSLQELVQQLSIKRFGKNVVVGDCFCGGGSIPFEAARMGCDTYASDLNPIAGLLTWASIHICGASEKELAKIKAFQKKVYDKVDQEITELGIEHNELGDRAVSYLYCVEAHCPECGVKVPMAPSWIIGKGTKTVAKLTLDGDHYNITVKMGASAQEMKEADAAGTATSKGLVCPHCGKTTPISVIRHDRKDENGNTVYGLRPWEKSEFEFRSNDVYNERLYAVKYEHIEIMPNGSLKATRYYRAPNERDMQNEQKIRKIVADNIALWQEQGLVPSMEIESGYNTDQIIRERGWTHWNHLFNARQLTINYLFYKNSMAITDSLTKAGVLLGINKCILFNSRLSMWVNSPGVEKTVWIFTNQAFNTMFNYGSSAVRGLLNCWFYSINTYETNKSSIVKLLDARDINSYCNYWITDPPYADAVNYHELSEVFLAWDKRLLQETFPEGYTDSKRILAIRGD